MLKQQDGVTKKQQQQNQNKNKKQKKNHVFDHETRKSGPFPCYRLKINDFLRSLKIAIFTPLQQIPCYCRNRLGTLRLISWWRVTYIIVEIHHSGRRMGLNHHHDALNISCTCQSHTMVLDMFACTNALAHTHSCIYLSIVPCRNVCMHACSSPSMHHPATAACKPAGQPSWSGS